MEKTIKAKKHLGQHFLVDNAVIDKIMAAISDLCQKDVAMIEVGPGPGVLTKKLVDLFSSFQAVEFDRDMVKLLLQDIDPTNIINEDFLGIESALSQALKRMGLSLYLYSLIMRLLNYLTLAQKLLILHPKSTLLSFISKERDL